MKIDTRTVFLTGATGALGSYLLNILLENNCHVFVLSRGKNNLNAKERVVKALNFWRDNPSTIDISNLTVLEGDICSKNLGLSKRDIGILKNQVTEVFHCAAATKMTWSLYKLRKVNLQGTRNVLELSSKFHKQGILKKLHYVSTMFICGDHKGEFAEDNFDMGQKFNNYYEQSKFEAEELVKTYIGEGLEISIFRPSIILGEYDSGKITDFKMFYEAIYIVSLGILDKIPFNPKRYINCIPVDLAAKAIFVLSANKINGMSVYHIVSPNHISIGNILETVSKFFNFKKPKPIPLSKFRVLNAQPLAKRMLEIYIPYFNLLSTFNSEKTQVSLSKYNFQYPIIDNEYLFKVFKFCNQRKFIKIRK